MTIKTVGQRLPLAERPRDFENVQGYVLRLTTLNEYERSRWIYQMLECDTSSITYTMLATAAAGFPELIGCSKEYLTAIAYSSSGADNHNIINVGKRGVIASSLMEIKHPKICPGCVQEFGAAFALWDMKFYGVCSRHKCQLIDHCTDPNCRRRLTWWRSKLNCCAGCKKPFTLAPNQKVSDPVLLAFSSLLERTWGVPFSNDLETTNCHWDNAEFSEVMEGIRMLASRLTVALGTDRITARLPAQVLYRVVARAFYDWPNGFFEYVNAVIEADIREGRGFSIANTSRLGSLFHRVMEGGNYPYFAHMKDALLEFIHGSRFGVRVTSKGGNRLNQIPSYQKQFMTRSEVMKELGISAPTFHRAFAKGILVGEVLQMGQQHVYRIHVSSVEKYKEKHR